MKQKGNRGPGNVPKRQDPAGGGRQFKQPADIRSSDADATVKQDAFNTVKDWLASQQIGTGSRLAVVSASSAVKLGFPFELAGRSLGADVKRFNYVDDDAALKTALEAFKPDLVVLALPPGTALPQNLGTKCVNAEELLK